MEKPNAVEKYNGAPEYFCALVERTGLSQREIARRLGIGYSSLRAYMDGSRAIIYPVQYALEQLAAPERFEQVFNLASGQAVVTAEVKSISLPEAEALANEGELPKHWDYERELWLCEFSINRVPAGRFFSKPSGLGLDMKDSDGVLRHCLGLAKDRGVV